MTIIIVKNALEIVIRAPYKILKCDFINDNMIAFSFKINNAILVIIIDLIII